MEKVFENQLEKGDNSFDTQPKIYEGLDLIINKQ